MKTALGTQLNEQDRRHVLAAFVHRFTAEHRPQWASEPRPDGGEYEVQFASDEDWLANTLFAVRNDGRLDGRARFCKSSPTWPNRKAKANA